MYVVKIRPVWATKDSDCLFLRSYRADRWGRVLWHGGVRPLAKTFPTRAAALQAVAALHHRKRDAEFRPTFTVVKA